MATMACGSRFAVVSAVVPAVVAAPAPPLPPLPTPADARTALQPLHQLPPPPIHPHDAPERE